MLSKHSNNKYPVANKKRSKSMHKATFAVNLHFSTFGNKLLKQLLQELEFHWTETGKARLDGESVNWNTP
jgi:hypothetical protein